MAVWLGAEKKDNNWVWDDNQDFKYTHWEMGQPDGCCGSNVIYATLNVTKQRSFWDDTDVEVQHNFICKYTSILLRLHLKKYFE